MEDLLVGMRLNGASDGEIESRFGLNRGDAVVLERVLLGRGQKADAKRSNWRRWAAGSPADRSSPASLDSDEG
jgi:hypothetical protein